MNANKKTTQTDQGKLADVPSEFSRALQSMVEHVDLTHSTHRRWKLIVLFLTVLLTVSLLVSFLLAWSAWSLRNTSDRFAKEVESVSRVFDGFKDDLKSDTEHATQIEDQTKVFVNSTKKLEALMNSPTLVWLKDFPVIAEGDETKFKKLEELREKQDANYSKFREHEQKVLESLSGTSSELENRTNTFELISKRIVSELDAIQLATIGDKTEEKVCVVFILGKTIRSNFLGIAGSKLTDIQTLVKRTHARYSNEIGYSGDSGYIAWNGDEKLPSIAISNPKSLKMDVIPNRYVLVTQSVDECPLEIPKPNQTVDAIVLLDSDKPDAKEVVRWSKFCRERNGKAIVIDYKSRDNGDSEKQLEKSLGDALLNLSAPRGRLDAKAQPAASSPNSLNPTSNARQSRP